jgi:uncharacterized protein (DUF2384 family)
MKKSVVYTRACELFHGDKKAARQWMKRKNQALGGLAPEEADEQLVLNLIGRIENGVFS